MLNKLKNINRFPIIIIIMLGLILAQIAPYNTKVIENFAWRFAYWWAIGMCSWYMWGMLNNFLEPRLKIPYLVVGSLVTIGMTLPLITLIMVINYVFFHETNSAASIGDFWLRLVITSQSIYFLVYLVVANIIKARAKQSATGAKPPLPHFLKNSMGDLLYITAEDHYIRIQTTSENKLILYKLNDAIKQLAMSDIEGMSVHRSHWVAKSAIKTHVKNGRKNWLELINGDQLPISATYLKRLKQAEYI